MPQGLATIRFWYLMRPTATIYLFFCCVPPRTFRLKVNICIYNCGNTKKKGETVNKCLNIILYDITYLEYTTTSKATKQSGNQK